MTDFEPALLLRIRALAAALPRVLVAIDGRCAAGKTTLAASLQAQLACNVFHMDDFFLRPEQRTPERLRQPGGNVDFERFLTEVLRPLRDGAPVTYRPYDCERSSCARRFTRRQGRSISSRGPIPAIRRCGIFMTCTCSSRSARRSSTAALLRAMVKKCCRCLQTSGFRWRRRTLRGFKSRSAPTFAGKIESACG